MRTWSSDSGCDAGPSIEEDEDVMKIVDEAVYVWMGMMERYLQQYSHKTKEALFNKCEGRIKLNDFDLFKCQALF